MKPTREEALAMAREAGFGNVVGMPHIKGIEALVAAAYELGVADEREECARLCEVHQYEWAYGSTYAAAIRNRSAS